MDWPGSQEVLVCQEEVALLPVVEGEGGVDEVAEEEDVAVGRECVGMEKVATIQMMTLLIMIVNSI